MYILARRAGMGLFLRADGAVRFVQVNGLLGMDPLVPGGIIDEGVRRWHRDWSRQRIEGLVEATTFIEFFEVFMDDAQTRIVADLETRSAAMHFARRACFRAMRRLAAEPTPLAVWVSGGLEDWVGDEKTDLSTVSLESETSPREIREWVYQRFYRWTLAGIQAAHFQIGDFMWLVPTDSVDPEDVRNDLDQFLP